ncbi:MAG TPA: hypothetical protein GYA07_08375 [Verrucomicrobia bacterium]|nr:hypothetical protein [Verrucomicrobiota bacterium]HOP96119.1 hypothetical protein [Verrucomicrobiota bacterium]HPU56576.1 hypothetical protein [Verrucomicrobiota bacterium]
MKTTFPILVAILSAAATFAQTAPSTPQAPATAPQTPPSQPTPAPGQPAEKPAIVPPAQSVIPTSPPIGGTAQSPAALTNQQVFQNVFGNQPDLADAQAALLNLQAEVQQALPILRSLTSGLYAATTGGVPPPGSPAEARANAQAQAPPISPTGRPAVPQAIIAARADVVGMLGSNVYGMDRETHRQMVILHNQLQQVLPLLQQLNGTADAVSIVRNPSGTNAPPFPFTNRFVPVNTLLLPGRNTTPTPR